MVEGPGTRRNGQKVERVLKRRVQNIQCISNPNVISMNEHQYYLSQVFTIGKELFVIFAREDCTQNEEEVALRLHFGMNGSLELNNLTSSYTTNKRNSRKGPPSIRIDFSEPISGSDSVHINTVTTTVVTAYQTTVSSPMNAKIPRQKFTNLSSCDVCNTQFNLELVLKKMRNNMIGDRIISDALLDQNIAPGIGNIIKIEGLHNARLHPKQMISSLSDDQLRLVILSCRSYAMKWFKHGRAPQKSVYNQMSCGTCKEAICMQRVGYSSRTTFWCSICQPLLSSIEINQDTLEPQTNSDCNTGKDKEQPMMSQVKGFQKVCPLHGPNTLVLRRARNGAHENSKRIFHSCKFKNCKYFSWADTHFPLCNCRKRAVLLVSKTERTGGKFFFSCRNESRSEKCSYFAWAQQKDLERLGDRLTPLL